MSPDNLFYSPNAVNIAACGLYCGACRKFTQGKCSGCKNNDKASWCKIRLCCKENGYVSCADCTLMPLEDCKKFNNFIGKLFGFIFRSDRTACIRRIKAIGHTAFAQEMHGKQEMTIKR